jgi:hypothetical protein
LSAVSELHEGLAPAAGSTADRQRPRDWSEAAHGQAPQNNRSARGRHHSAGSATFVARGEASEKRVESLKKLVEEAARVGV